jgi:group II intron reverse transcriptase/maturase
MQRAWKRVKANKGAAGVDGLDIARTGQHLKHAWPTIKQQLMEGTYRPLPVRRVGIPKPDGSERELGIPTVTDRLIQQALLQVLRPLIDPTFSEHSHGFRPGRRARDAVLAAQQYVQEGYRTVADVDLSKFFDRVNHDILIDRLRKRVNDAGVTPRVLGKLDEWMRHRLRAIHLKHWRRGATIYRELLELDLNYSNRPVRTRMPGGVAGDRSAC